MPVLLGLLSLLGSKWSGKRDQQRTIPVGGYRGATRLASWLRKYGTSFRVLDSLSCWALKVLAALAG